jgi:hypothetical protein
VNTFGENLLSIPQLFSQNIATLFHPIHRIMIANADTMVVPCPRPLGIGRLNDGAFLIDIVVSDQI